MTEEKSIVLIDAENILKSWQDYCNINNISRKIDYLKLVKRLSKGTNLIRAYFYGGTPEKISIRKKNFLNALQYQGIQLRTKVLKDRQNKCSKCGYIDYKQIQKGVDVSLATDILRHAWQRTCDICIVVSGDEDYKDAIECVKDKGIKVWVAAFRNSLSNELRKTADNVIFLDEIFEEIGFDKKI